MTMVLRITTIGAALLLLVAVLRQSRNDVGRQVQVPPIQSDLHNNESIQVQKSLQKLRTGAQSSTKRKLNKRSGRRNMSKKDNDDKRTGGKENSKSRSTGKDDDDNDNDEDESTAIEIEVQAIEEIEEGVITDTIFPSAISSPEISTAQITDEQNSNGAGINSNSNLYTQIATSYPLTAASVPTDLDATTIVGSSDSGQTATGSTFTGGVVNTTDGSAEAFGDSVLDGNLDLTAQHDAGNATSGATDTLQGQFQGYIDAGGEAEVYAAGGRQKVSATGGSMGNTASNIQVNLESENAQDTQDTHSWIGMKSADEKKNSDEYAAVENEEDDTDLPQMANATVSQSATSGGSTGGISTIENADGSGESGASSSGSLSTNSGAAVVASSQGTTALSGGASQVDGSGIAETSSEAGNDSTQTVGFGISNALLGGFGFAQQYKNEDPDDTEEVIDVDP